MQVPGPRHRLDTDTSNRTWKSTGSSRPKAYAAFVAAMEDVLEVYARPHDPARPTGTVRLRIRAQRHLMLFAPLEGWREVKVTERRTAIDYAQVLKELSDVHFAKAEKIVLVQTSTPTTPPGGAAPRRALRMALHAQARQLAQYDRIRACYPVQSMSRSAIPDRRTSSARLLPGFLTATLTMSTGALPPQMPASG